MGTIKPCLEHLAFLSLLKPVKGDDQVRPIIDCPRCSFIYCKRPVLCFSVDVLDYWMQ